MKSHHQLLVALVLGLVLGALLHPFASDPMLISLVNYGLQPIGQVFMRLILMVVVPMVGAAIVLGVYELGKGQGLGKVAGKTFGYTVVTSTLSVAIGITLVNIVGPGRGLTIDPAAIAAQREQVASIQGSVTKAKPFMQALVEIIPKNPIDSAARALDGEMLAVMFFALLFGAALTVSHRQSTTQGTLIPLLEEVFAACMRVIGWVMKLAPLAVFAIVFSTAFRLGVSVIFPLLSYVAVVLAGLLIQQFVVFTALLKGIARRAPLQFFKDCEEAYLMAFSTASSNATLPKTLEVAEVKLKLPKPIARFVLTVGATANQNGTALFEGVTVLFLAQAYGIDLSLGQQIQVAFMSILAGIGTAGVPGGSLPLVMILLQTVGVPPEGMGLVLGVDRFLDMCRTTLNVSGDLVIAALVGKGPPRFTLKS